MRKKIEILTLGITAMLTYIITIYLTGNTFNLVHILLAPGMAMLIGTLITNSLQEEAKEIEEEEQNVL